MKRLGIVAAAIALLFTVACDPEDPDIPDVNMVVTGEHYRHGEHVMTARIDGHNCIMYGRAMSCDWSDQ